MKRVVRGCIPYCEDMVGWTRREHLSYRRSQPLHTPHNVSGYIPTQILTWPLTVDVDPSILLFMLHAILPKVLGGITRAANTTVTQSVHHQHLNCLNFRSSRMCASRNSSVGIGTRLRVGWQRFDSWKGQQAFLYPTVSRPVLWLRGRDVSLGLKRYVREADHSSPSSAEIMNGGAIPPLLPFVFKA
jgi:hypothetical protein